MLHNTAPNIVDWTELWITHTSSKWHVLYKYDLPVSYLTNIYQEKLIIEWFYASIQNNFHDRIAETKQTKV